RAGLPVARPFWPTRRVPSNVGPKEWTGSRIYVRIDPAAPPGSTPLAAGMGRAERGEAPGPARPAAEGVGMDRLGQAAPGRVRCRVAPTALALLESARHGLANAGDGTSAGGPDVAAPLAGLRAGAGLAAGRPGGGGGGGRGPAGAREGPPQESPAQRLGAPAAGRAGPGRVGGVLRGRGGQAGGGGGGATAGGFLARGRRSAPGRRVV